MNKFHDFVDIYFVKISRLVIGQVMTRSPKLGFRLSILFWFLFLISQCWWFYNQSFLRLTFSHRWSFYLCGWVLPGLKCRSTDVIYGDFFVAVFMQCALDLMDIFHFNLDGVWILGLNPFSLILIHVTWNLLFGVLGFDVVLELLSLSFRVAHISNKLARSIHDITERLIFLFQCRYFLNFEVVLQLKFCHDISCITFLLQEVIMDSIFVKTKNSSFNLRKFLDLPLVYIPALFPFVELWSLC